MTTTSIKQETPRQRLKRLKQERAYWQGIARMDARSYSRTLKKVAEVEMICALLEAEIAEMGKK